MRKLSIAILTLITLVVAPATASAHAGLVSANPVANSSASFMPKNIQITFSENLMQIQGKDINSISLSYMKNTDSGVVIALSDIKVDGPTISATIPDGQYKVGNYSVTYSIVSQDGHKLSDSYQFSLHSFGSPLTTNTPKPEVAKESHGAIPLPIALAIAVVIGIGGYLVLAKRRREQ